MNSPTKRLSIVIYLRSVDIRKPITGAAPQIYDCLLLGIPNLYVFPLYEREFGFLIKDCRRVLCTLGTRTVHLLFSSFFLFVRMLFVIFEIRVRNL